MRILIVEDDMDSREMLTVLLEQYGHEVVGANNGREGWDSFQQLPCSLTISDWLMPDVDGLELCRRIRQANLPFYPYVILLTALQGKSNYLSAMNAGADDFISKPYDPEELRARLIVAERIVKLQERVKRLEGVLPTCMYCKKIRDQRDVWVGIEQYITQRSDASFSHGVCPDCYESMVKPELRRVHPPE
ncbi:MAG: response regulator transcription factor [Acidobacteria bacterium]|nr:response regulator transcription factor [Acidobacteriota bacterium]